MILYIYILKVFWSQIKLLILKGFKKIENLEEFTGLMVLYLEGNGFLKIEGLEKCNKLKSLFLHENCIKKIENLDE